MVGFLMCATAIIIYIIVPSFYMVKRVKDSSEDNFIRKSDDDFVYFDGYITKEDAEYTASVLKKQGYFSEIIYCKEAIGYPYNVWVRPSHPGARVNDIPMSREKRIRACTENNIVIKYDKEHRHR